MNFDVSSKKIMNERNIHIESTPLGKYSLVMYVWEWLVIPGLENVWVVWFKNIGGKWQSSLLLFVPIFGLYLSCWENGETAVWGLTNVCFSSLGTFNWVINCTRCLFYSWYTSSIQGLFRGIFFHFELITVWSSSIIILILSQKYNFKN